MKPIFLIILACIGISCHGSQKESFSDLLEAFQNWYYKSHPVKASLLGIHDYDTLFKIYSSDAITEYIADVNRFKIELSQIDETKLSEDAHAQYKILESGLQSISFNWEVVQSTTWNPNYIISSIYDGLVVLVDRESMDMNRRVKAIISRLEFLPSLLEIQSQNIKYSSKRHISLAIDNIENIQRLFTDLPLLVYADHQLLDKIDNLISQNSILLNNHKKWLSETVQNYPRAEQLQNAAIYSQHFKNTIGYNYTLKNTVEFANNNIHKLQDKLFNVAISIYLQSNDEPVWVDRDDTLKVIKWSIDHIYNNHPTSGSILTEIYASSNRIQAYSMKNKFIKNVPKMNIGLKENYHPLLPIKMVKYFANDTHPNLLINKDIANNAIRSQFNTTLLDLEHFGRYIPGEWYLLHGQSYTEIVKIFPNQFTISGWGNFCNEVYADSKETSKLVKIIQLKKHLEALLLFILEYKYYFEINTLADNKKWLINTGFMTDYEADEVLNNIFNNTFDIYSRYIGGIEFDKIFNKVSVQKENYTINDFINKTTEIGPVPLYVLETQILR